MPEWVDSGGVRLAVEVVGEGAPVTVVAHGLTGSREQLAIFAPYVPGTKLLFDFRGHGDSGRPTEGAYSMDDFAADIESVATAYGATGVIGASLGSGASLRLLTRDPDRFERLVVLLPARLEGTDPATLQARERLLAIADILERHPIEEAADRIIALEEASGAYDGFAGSKEVRRRAILAMNGDGIPRAIRQAIDDPPVRGSASISRVSARALVVGQEGDRVHAASVAREVAEAIPNAELLLYPSPQALLERIPEVVSRIADLLSA